MSGVATPPIITQPFASDAAAPYITNPIPLTPPVTLGLASYETGFPPLNMTNPASGGVPPSGADMNGILFAVSAWCASIQLGQWPAFSQPAADAVTGYAVGAKVSDGTYTWTNTLDANTVGPATDPSKWRRDAPLYAASAPAAGTYANVVLAGPSDYVLEVDTTAGDVNFSGFVAQHDGQRVTLMNRGASLLSLLALTGSTAGNQIRIPSDLSAVANQSVTIQYSQGASKWLLA